MTQTMAQWKWSSVLWLCAGLLAASAIPAAAQFETAVVLGTVIDPSGAPVPAATITLTNVQTGITNTTQTDEQRQLSVPQRADRQYQVVAEHPGFSTAVARDIGVAVNARRRVDLSLQVGGVADEVTVTAARQLLETDSSERGQVIGRQQIVNLPLNGRSYSSLALLSTGVLESNQNGVGTSGREGSFNVNGLRNTANNFQLDGIDNNAYGTSNQGFSNQVIQVSPDAVAEFKVQTNNYSAEYGRSGGAVVNASYRSGTNQFHGTGWEFFRDTAMNATGFFQPTGGTQAVAEPPPVRLRRWRSNQPRPDVLLHRLRGFPADPADAGLLDDPDARATPGHSRRSGRPPVHRPGVSGRHAAAADRLRPQGAGRTAGPERAGRDGQQLPEGRPEPERLQQVQPAPRPQVQRRAHQLRARRPAEERRVRGAQHRRSVGQQSERLHQGAGAAVHRRHDLRHQPDVVPRRAAGRVAHRGRQAAAGHRRAQHVRAVRHHRPPRERSEPDRRPDAAVDHRVLAARPAGDQSRSSRTRST